MRQNVQTPPWHLLVAPTALQVLCPHVVVMDPVSNFPDSGLQTVVVATGLTTYKGKVMQAVGQPQEEPVVEENHRRGRLGVLRRRQRGIIPALQLPQIIFALVQGEGHPEMILGRQSGYPSLGQEPWWKRDNNFCNLRLNACIHCRA